jgi:hypothetical protein
MGLFFAVFTNHVNTLASQSINCQHFASLNVNTPTPVMLTPHILYINYVYVFKYKNTT